MRQSKRSVEKERFWRRVLKEQPNSGLTVKAFCKQQGVSVPSFYAWRRKLVKRNAGSRGPDDDKPPQFVPVTVIPPVPTVASDSGRVPIEIVTPGGFTLRVDRVLAPREIAELLQVVLACQSEVTSC